MVRYIGYRVCYYSIGYSDVPGPQLVQLVALLVGRRPLLESWGESSLGQGGVHFIELPVEVSTQYDLGGWVLPDDTLGKADDCVSPLAHESLKPGF